MTANLSPSPSAQPVVDEAPAPLLAGLRRPHHRVAALAEVRGRVPTRRGVTAGHQPAGQALAKVHPGAQTLLDALLAHVVDPGVDVSRRLLEVFAQRDRPYMAS